MKLIRMIAKLFSRHRWMAMRVLSAVLLFWFFLPTSAFSAGDTNELTLFKDQGRRQAYEWRISEARIAATPEWNMGSTNIPLAPDKAWLIAREWFRQHGSSSPDLVKIEIKPFVPDVYMGPERRNRLKGLLNRFYYRFECVHTQFDSMSVVILMDGSVLEPVRIADLPPQETK